MILLKVVLGCEYLKQVVSESDLRGCIMKQLEKFKSIISKVSVNIITRELATRVNMSNILKPCSRIDNPFFYLLVPESGIHCNCLITFSSGVNNSAMYYHFPIS